MSRKIRSLMVALLLGVSAMTFVSAVVAPVVQAEEVDCTKDENKDKDECKNK